MKFVKGICWLVAALGCVALFSAFAAEAPPPQELPQPEKTTSLIDFYLKGGYTMHVILACSVLSVAIIFERLINLRKGKIISTAFIEEIKRHWYRRDTARAMQACKEYDISLSHVLRAGLARFNFGIEAVEKAIEAAGQHEAALMKQNLMLLGFLANIAPMLGLLGTVLGLTRSFDAIASFGMAGNPGLVAAGVSEALITTVFGLLVGIPTLGAYYYFKRKVDIRVLEMEEVSLALIEDLAYDGMAGAEIEEPKPVSRPLAAGERSR